MAYLHPLQEERNKDDDFKEGSSKAKNPNTLPSYTAMIAQAILSKSAQRCALSEIYEFMERRFPPLSEKGNGWRNCVRHTLSLSDCFMKLHRPENGRSCHWAVHPTYLPRFLRGDFRKRRQSRARRSNEQSSQQDQFSFPTFERDITQYENRSMQLATIPSRVSVEQMDHSAHFHVPVCTEMMQPYQHVPHMSQMAYGSSFMGNQQNTGQQSYYQNPYARNYKNTNSYYDAYSQNYRAYYQ